MRLKRKLRNGVRERSRNASGVPKKRQEAVDSSNGPCPNKMCALRRQCVVREENPLHSPGGVVTGSIPFRPGKTKRDHSR